MGVKRAATDPGPEGQSWEARARAAGVDVEAKRRAWEEAIDARDAIIMEGYDAGRHVGDVARAALVTKGRVTQIVAARSAEQAQIA